MIAIEIVSSTDLKLITSLSVAERKGQGGGGERGEIKFYILSKRDLRGITEKIIGAYCESEAN